MISYLRFSMSQTFSKSRRHNPPDNRRNDIDTRHDRSDEQRDEQAHQAENEDVITRGALAVAGGTGADQVHVLLIGLPHKIERVADKRYRPNDIIEPDVKRHPQQRDLRHSVSHTRDQNIKRRKHRQRVANIGYQPDQRIQPKPPARPRHTKKPIEVKRQVIEALLDLDLFLNISHKLATENTEVTERFS